MEKNLNDAPYWMCPNCKTLVSIKEKFCTKCGYALPKPATEGVIPHQAKNLSDSHVDFSSMKSLNG